MDRRVQHNNICGSELGGLGGGWEGVVLWQNASQSAKELCQHTIVL